MLHTALKTEEMAGITEQAFFKTDALIAGCWQGSTDGDTFAVENPATDEVIALVANCGVIETEQAIASGVRRWPAGRDPGKKPSQNSTNVV